jgi:hypothetical protein
MDFSGVCGWENIRTSFLALISTLIKTVFLTLFSTRLRIHFGAHLGAHFKPCIGINAGVGAHFILLFILNFTVFFTATSQANEPLRPSHANQYSEYDQQKFIKVKTATVAWANYWALRRDFLALQKLTDQQIDHWIIDNFAFINKNQLYLNNIRNSPILTEETTRAFIVPLTYGRAAVAPILDSTTNESSAIQSFMDLKGSGLNQILLAAKQRDEYRSIIKRLEQAKSQGQWEEIQKIENKLNQQRVLDHSDGLMSLGEAIAEVTRQIAVQIGFNQIARSSTYLDRRETVESYFIISLGFNILKDNNQSIPAGMIGRQAHIRGTNVPTTEIYTDPFGGMQGTISHSSIDFGGVFVKLRDLHDRFDVVTNGNPKNAQQSKPWIWGHETAQAYIEQLHHNPLAARSLVTKHIEQTMIAPFTMNDHESKAYTTGELSKYLLSFVTRDLAAIKIKSELSQNANNANKKSDYDSNLAKLLANGMTIATQQQNAWNYINPIDHWFLRFLEETQLIYQPEIQNQLIETALEATTWRASWKYVGVILHVLEKNHLLKDEPQIALRLLKAFVATGYSEYFESLKRLKSIHEKQVSTELLKTSSSRAELRPLQCISIFNN